MLIAFAATAHKDEVLAPIYKEQVDAALTEARQALGEEAFTTAWNKGSVMTLSQALDYSLQQPA